MFISLLPERRWVVKHRKVATLRWTVAGSWQSLPENRGNARPRFAFLVGADAGCLDDARRFFHVRSDCRAQLIG